MEMNHGTTSRTSDSCSLYYVHIMNMVHNLVCEVLPLCRLLCKSQWSGSSLFLWPFYSPGGSVPPQEQAGGKETPLRVGTEA